MKNYSTHITLFVSSTFKDMHERRDILRNKVQPLINEVANKTGYSVSFCDLRWGINSFGLEGSERMNKTLRVCLDTIDNCLPPTIALLGKDYGTIGDADAFREVCEEKSVVLDSYDISYTNLEIDYAKAKYNDLLVYMFDENTGDDPRLSELKKQLRVDYPDKIRNAVSDDSFADYIYNDLCNVLSPMWSKVYSPQELEYIRQWSFFNEKRSVFTARADELNLLFDRIRTDLKRLIISGPSGIGKSTLISELVFRLNDSGYQVLPIECGLTEQSSTALDILRRVLDFLGVTCEATSSVKAMINAYGNQINTIDTGRKVIVIDGINQLIGDEETIIDLLMIPSKVSFVISATSNVNTKELPVYTLRPLTTNDVYKVIEGVLRPYHKEIENDVVNAIMNKREVNNPLYITLLLHRLLIQNINDYEQIRLSTEGITSRIERDTIRIGHQIRIVKEASDTLLGLVRENFEVVGKLINSELVSKTLEFIALTRFGLRDSDLEMLIGDSWNDLDFHLLINYYQGFFIKRVDGRYDFSHSVFRFALKNSDDSIEANSLMLNAFSSLPINDPIRMKEYVYHMIAADEKEMFISYIITIYMDEDLSKCAAENIYYFSLRDEGKWIADLIKQYSDISDCFIDFIINRVSTMFNINDRETKIKLIILKAVEQQLSSNANIHNRLVQLLNLYYAMAWTSHDLDEFEAAARYIKAYYDLCLLHGDFKNGKDKFKLYNSTIGLMKNAVRNSEIGECFFVIAEECFSSGAFDYGDSMSKGLYLGCLGEAYGRVKNYEKQLELYLKDLDLRKKGYKDNPSDYNRNKLLGGYYNVGNGYAMTGKPHESLPYYRYAKRLVSVSKLSPDEKIRAVEIDNRINLYLNLGISILLAKDDLEEALTCKEEEIKWMIKYNRLKGKRLISKQLIADYEGWFRVLCGENQSFKYQSVWRFNIFCGYIRAIVDGAIDAESNDIVNVVVSDEQNKYYIESRDGKPNDEGMIVSDKNVFYGQISQGKRQGLGCSRYSGSRFGYKGLWKDDKHNGYGETHVYSGEWRDGEFNGYGVFEQEGKRICGLWKSGKLIKKYPFFVVNKKLSVIRESIDMNKLDAYEEKVDNYIKDNS